MNFMRFIKFTALLVLICMLWMSCTTTHQTPKAATSGFLKDYSQLKEGKGEQALMVYIDPDVNFSRYNKIMIDPIRLMASEDSDMAKISKEDFQKIADYFYAALLENLSKDYTVVTESGDRTMRLRVALTDVRKSKVVLDTISSVGPILIAISAVKKVATGTHVGIGSAIGEMELLDSVSGKRLIAAVDGRAGKKYTGRLDKFGKWNDTKDACDYWAQRIAMSLDDLSYTGYILKGDEE